MTEMLNNIENFSVQDILDSHEVIGYGKAYGKVILMGEHAVVYDHPAIAMPLKAVKAHAFVTESLKNAGTTLACSYYKGLLKDAPNNLDNLRKAVDLTLELLSLEKLSLDIKIISSIPSERGMGSSAAVCVALVRAICNFYKKEISEELLRFIVNQAEVIAHGSTSGIDTLVTSGSNPVVYKKSMPPKSFSVDMSACLVVADSGRACETKKAVGKVAELYKEKPEFVGEMMEAIGSFSMQAYEAIKEDNPVLLGRLMSYNHYYLNQLEVSDKYLDRLVNSAWLAGALGAKLSGGGIGGCVIALASNKDSAKEIMTAMKNAGASKAWLLELSN